MPKSISSPWPAAARLVLVAAIGAGACDVRAAEKAPAARSHLQPVSEIAGPRVGSDGLGIRLSRASPVLRQQIALERGAGLVVDDVPAGTRAAGLGFRQHDVLVRIDDQLLVLPEQFDVLLESAGPGDPLVCTVLRAGREVTIPLAGEAAAGRTVSGQPGPSSPLRRPLRPTASSLAIAQPAVPAAAEHESHSRMRQLSDETLLRQDADFEIKLTRGDTTRLLVRDHSGRVVFDGSIEAEADRGRLPAAIRGRVSEMERLLEPRPVAAGQSRPVAEIGRLGITPVEIR